MLSKGTNKPGGGCAITATHDKRQSRKAGGRTPRQSPEGPYETQHATFEGLPADPDAGHFILLFERLQNEAQQALGLSQDQREVRIIVHLVRRHLAGQLLTSSSLAAASGLSYGTAVRTIADMCRKGLIVRRPRTSTGKSVSLHPSEELLARWHRFARRGSELVKAVLDRKRATPLTHSANTLPPPAVLPTKLSLSRGLRVLMHADPTFMAMRSLKNQFEMILGVSIRSRALSIDRLHDELVENSRLAVSRYDIVAVDLPWFGEMGSNGWLMPLDDVLGVNGDRADFYPDTLASSRWQGRQLGIPIIMTAELLVYRTDLFDRAEVEPPRTIADTIDAARRLHLPASGVSGIAWNGGRGTPLGHTMLMIMSAFGRPVLNLRRAGGTFDAEHIAGEEMRPMFLSLEARQTAEYLTEILQYSSPNVLDMNWYGRAIAYGRGRAALAYSHTLLALYETDRSSPAYRLTGYLPHPIGPHGRPIAPMGGYALALPANLAPERIEAARTALRALSSASATKLYMINGSLSSPRASVSRDPEVQALSPVIAEVDALADAGVVRMWPRPPAPFIAEIIDIAGEEVHDLLTKTKSIAASLRDAQNRADALMRAHGYY